MDVLFSGEISVSDKTLEIKIFDFKSAKSPEFTFSHLSGSQLKWDTAAFTPDPIYILKHNKSYAATITFCIKKMTPLIIIPIPYKIVLQDNKVFINKRVKCHIYPLINPSSLVKHRS